MQLRVIRLALLVLIFLCASAQAQSIVQGGAVTAGHASAWRANGVLGDAGSSAAPTLQNQGAIFGGANVVGALCVEDGYNNRALSPSGYYQLCLSANALGGGLISYGAFNGAPQLGLNIALNGTLYPFPGSGTGNVLGPTSPTPTAGDLVLWNGGTTVKDGGLPPIDFIVAAGGSIQTALTAAASAGGGTVRVRAGTYAQTQPLTMSSNTRLACDKGALITATNAGWTGQKTTLTNTNVGSTSRVDHDLDVEGCTFQALGTYVTDGAYHHINFGAATRVRVSYNTFIGGGDGTAFTGNLETTVSDNYMTGAENACWDHFGGAGTLASLSMTVSGNYCQTNLFGILVTGTNVGSVSAAVAQYADIHGNTVVMSGSGAQAAIWVNGIGAAGSGASDIKVTSNSFSGDGTAPFVCMKNSGASNNNTFAHNTCSNMVSAAISQGFNDSADSGGLPANTLLLGNTFDNIPTQNANVALIALGGANSSAVDNFATGGNYPSIVWLNGTNNKAINNSAPAGTGDRYNISSATDPIIWDLDPTIAGQIFRTGNSLFRATTDCGSTICVGVAGDATSAIQVAQPSGANEGIGTVNARGGFYENGVKIPTVLFGTTGSYAPGLISANSCTPTTINVAISGANVGMVAVANPTTSPGAGIIWIALVASANIVNVQECNITTGGVTPSASTFNVRVLQ